MERSKVIEHSETMTFIETHDRRRRDLWLRLFGTDSLPVKSGIPRWQVKQGAFGETVELCYDLDTSPLHPMAVQRFADYASKRTGHPCTVEDMDSYPIKAAGCEVVEIETDETVGSSLWMKRPFSLFVPRPAAVGAGAYG